MTAITAKQQPSKNVITVAFCRALMLGNEHLHFIKVFATYYRLMGVLADDPFTLRNRSSRFSLVVYRLGFQINQMPKVNLIF